MTPIGWQFPSGRMSLEWATVAQSGHRKAANKKICLPIGRFLPFRRQSPVRGSVPYCISIVGIVRSIIYTHLKIKGKILKNLGKRLRWITQNLALFARWCVVRLCNWKFVCLSMSEYFSFFFCNHRVQKARNKEKGNFLSNCTKIWLKMLFFSENICMKF